MGVNPGGDGGDMSPPIRGLSPPKKILKKITLSIVKNICMYTYNNLSRKKKTQKVLLETVEFPLPFLTVVWPTACFPSSSHLVHTRVRCVAAAQLMLNSSK